MSNIRDGIFAARRMKGFAYARCNARIYRANACKTGLTVQIYLVFHA
jgi:hypothetical protein